MSAAAVFLRHFAALALLCHCAPGMAAGAGTLVLSGGGDNSGLWPILFDRLRDPDAGVVVITPPGKAADSSRDVEELREIRPAKVKALDAGASPEAVSATLAEARMIWLDEGPWAASAALDGPVRQALAAALDRGALVGGSAGGAKILASALADRALFRNIAVFTAANPRKSGEFRKILAALPDSLCLRVDASTAVLLRESDALVVGAGFARFGSLEGGSPQTSELASGDHFDLAARRPSGRSARGRGAVRVAIYSGIGTRTQKEAVIHDCLADEKGRFTVAMLDPDEIRHGGLKDFDVLIQSGGRASEQAEELGDDGRERIREFVRGGGGYVGLNAGSYLAAADRPYYLRLLNAKVIDREHWSRGKGKVQIRFTAEGLHILGSDSRTAQVQFSNSPLLVRDAQPDLPSYDELAIYEDEIFSANDAPQGVMKGASAMEAAPYGEGRVFCSGPHPAAKDADWKAFLQRAVLWAAGREDTTSSGAF